MGPGKTDRPATDNECEQGPAPGPGLPWQRRPSTEAQILAVVRELLDRTAPVGARLEDVLAGQREIRQQLADLQTEVGRLAALRTTVERHERDFRLERAERNSRREDIGTPAHRARVDVFARFERLVRQQVGTVVNEALRERGGGDRPAKAKLIRDVALALFPEAGTGLGGTAERLGRLALPIVASRADRLVTEASGIRTEAGEAGLVWRWDDWVRDNLDQADVWHGCESEATAFAFVVQPAWTAGTDTIGRAVIFLR